MSVEKRSTLKEVMILAWQFVRQNGYDLSKALKCAWANIKLHRSLKTRIVKFYFQKVDGTIREAFGTLRDDLLPETKNDNRKKNNTIQVYFDTEKSEYRCFKKANLINIV
jgi:hypothetical protein